MLSTRLAQASEQMRDLRCWTSPLKSQTQGDCHGALAGASIPLWPTAPTDCSESYVYGGNTQSSGEITSCFFPKGSLVSNNI